MIRPLGPVLGRRAAAPARGAGRACSTSASASTAFVGDDHVTDGRRSPTARVLARRRRASRRSGPRPQRRRGSRATASTSPTACCTDGALRPVADAGPLDGVAVVGDIARFPNRRSTRGRWRVEHWSIPTDTGRRAGAVLAAYLSGDAALRRGRVDHVGAAAVVLVRPVRHPAAVLRHARPRRPRRHPPARGRAARGVRRRLPPRRRSWSASSASGCCPGSTPTATSSGTRRRRSDGQVRRPPAQ